MRKVAVAYGRVLSALVRAGVRTWLLALLGALAFGLAIDTRVGMADSESYILEKFQAALDIGDLDGAVARFAPDADVIVERATADDHPVRIAVGRDQVRVWLRALIEDDAHLRLEDRPLLKTGLQGLRVVWIAEFKQRSLPLSASGSVSALVRDGHIASLSHFFTRADAATISSLWMERAHAAEAETSTAVLPVVLTGLVIVLTSGYLISASRPVRPDVPAAEATGLIAALRRVRHLD